MTTISPTTTSRLERVMSLLLGLITGTALVALVFFGPSLLGIPESGNWDFFYSWIFMFLEVAAIAGIGVAIHKKARQRTLFGLGLALGSVVPFLAFFAFLAALGMAIGS
ncbi:hypothetical protein ncot_05050 [Nocardioides sp. JQ2195]|uniref:hypothetical protein n=1 Tax=Nocardioides sp. JQ2195 TaxID=2592334 RepID=UPI00143EAD3E|nr:hypothetical protein [Nocardioides sp. JQ2195]QIX26037.1 hypothetical protein ncot_05050 [Nocardioides sp. JQ2195]